MLTSNLLLLLAIATYRGGRGRNSKGLRRGALASSSVIGVVPRCTRKFGVACASRTYLLSVRSPRGGRDRSFRCTLIPENIRTRGVPTSCAIVRAPVQDIVYVASLRLSGFVGLRRLSTIINVADAHRLFGGGVGSHLGSKDVRGVNVRKGFSGRIVVDMGPSLVLVSPFGQKKCSTLGRMNVPLVPRLKCGRVAPLKRTR